MAFSEEGRRDLFILRYESRVLKETGFGFGVFQYFKDDDHGYCIHFPIRFEFQKNPHNLGVIVRNNFEQIARDAGTNFMNFEKKGYFPDSHFNGVIFTLYYDLSVEELSQFKLAFFNVNK